MSITRKVIQVGNSVAVTLPMEFLAKAKVKPGDEVEVDMAGDTVYVTSKKSLSPRPTPEFKSWLDKFSKKYEATIKELAHLP